MNRISIVGTTVCGKTTLASEVARILGSVHIELDALHWRPGWKAVSNEVFRRDVLETLEGPQWVTDGNYRSVRDLVWQRADCVVWLNYALPLILTRLLRRTARRIISREPCCNGNRENLRLLLSRESILLWALQSHGRHRRDYPALLGESADQGKSVLIHRSPLETRVWLDELRASRAATTSATTSQAATVSASGSSLRVSIVARRSA
jgi:adenylate kinase family enzyme